MMLHWHASRIRCSDIDSYLSLDPIPLAKMLAGTLQVLGQAVAAHRLARGASRLRLRGIRESAGGRDRDDWGEGIAGSYPRTRLPTFLCRGSGEPGSFSGLEQEGSRAPRVGPVEADVRSLSSEERQVSGLKANFIIRPGDEHLDL
eukprot:9414594-Pyramimonas_sp.AAC.1